MSSSSPKKRIASEESSPLSNEQEENIKDIIDYAKEKRAISRFNIVVVASVRMAKEYDVDNKLIDYYFERDKAEMARYMETRTFLEKITEMRLKKKPEIILLALDPHRPWGPLVVHQESPQQFMSAPSMSSHVKDLYMNQLMEVGTSGEKLLVVSTRFDIEMIYRLECLDTVQDIPENFQALMGALAMDADATDTPAPADAAAVTNEEVGTT